MLIKKKSLFICLLLIIFLLSIASNIQADEPITLTPNDTEIIITDKNHTITFEEEEYKDVKIELFEIEKTATVQPKIEQITNVEKIFFNTPIVSLSGDIKFEKATITLPKEGYVETIFKCENFDQEKFECKEEWQSTDIKFKNIVTETFDKNGSKVYNYDTISFEISSFSAYGGGRIEIIKAEHLDENKEFISDIYSEVSKKDGNWSETIQPNEYIRVTFSQSLKKENDITVFARSLDGNATIEIYRIDDNNLIAVIENINKEDWHKSFLQGLGEEEEIIEFDLKVTENPIQIDYIIDPSNDDFEDGDYTSNPTWTPRVDGGPITVVEAAAQSGNYGARFTGDGSSETKLTTPAVFDDLDTWAFVRASVVSGGHDAFYSFDPAAVYIIITNSGFKYGGTPAGGTPFPKELTAETDTWYIFRIKYISSTQKVTFWIYDEDGNELDTTGELTSNSSSAVSTVRLDIYNSNSVTDWDNIGYSDSDLPPTDSCSCPASGHWEIIDGDNCFLPTECNLTAGNLHIIEGQLTITSTGTLNIPTNYYAHIQKDNNLHIEKGGNLGKN